MEKGVTFLLPVPKFLLSLPSILLSFLLHLFVSVMHARAHTHTHTHTYTRDLSESSGRSFFKVIEMFEGQKEEGGESLVQLMIRSQRPFSGARLLSGVMSFGYRKGTCWHLPHSLLHRDSGTCLHRRRAGEDVTESFLSWTS